MKASEIDSAIEGYIENKEIAGGALLVRRGDDIIYRNCRGYSDIASDKALNYDSIYRLMSMTKPVTAVAVMQLAERGLLNIDDPVCMYLNGYHNMCVVKDRRYEYHDGMKIISLLPALFTFNIRKPHTVPAYRDITIRDLLTHSSGLEQGIYGLISMKKDRNPERTNLEQIEAKYSGYSLDFQPGTDTGYSPLAGFDLLAGIVEKTTGLSYGGYIRENILDPLGMKDTVYRLSPEQHGRLVHVYKKSRGVLRDVTGTRDETAGIFQPGPDFEGGSAGLYSTLDDYDRFTRMLMNEGELDGTVILKHETVKLMRSEASLNHLEPEPGNVWGLGMKIRQAPERSSSACTAGTYGWSGAYGTHFFISPKDNLSAVWMTNRTDLGGAGSPVSRRIEELVFGCFT